MDKTRKQILSKALKIRIFEQYLLELYAEGELSGTVHTCIGQELIPAVMSNYVSDNDVFLSNHRGHGHYLAFVGKEEKLLAELLGSEKGCSKGIGGSQHLYEENKFYSNGIQGGMSPVAAGLALNKKYSGDTGIVVLFIGDGTLGEGQLYEALNIYSLWNLKVLVVLENNSWSQSTLSRSVRAGDIEDRVNGFGLKYFRSDTNNLEVLDVAMQECIDYVRNNGPAFIEVETARLKSHSKGDDNRSEDLISDLWSRDILNKEKDQEWYVELSKEYKHKLQYIYKELHPLKYAEIHKRESFSFFPKIIDNSSIRISEQIHNGLKAILQNNKSIFIGEDIEWISEGNAKEYGGAFKVSGNLSNLLPDQVRNTPISEGIIAGVLNGFSLLGGFAIGEIMFGDFMTLTLDQILQHSSKFMQMYGVNIRLNGIIRTPMGGRRGYGPTHSQSLHGHFLGIPGVDLFALNYRLDSTAFYESLIESRNFSIVFEDKIDYSLRQSKPEIIEYDQQIDAIRGKSSSESKVLILGYGGYLKKIEDLVEELNLEGINIDLLWFVRLNNLDPSNYTHILNEKKLIVTIDEGPFEGGVMSYFISKMRNSNIANESKVLLLSNDEIISASAKVEEKTLDFVNRIKELLNGK